MRTRAKFGSFRIVGYVWAYQKRGMLHVHVIFSARTPRECAAAAYYVDQLDRLRHEYEFGFVDRKPFRIEGRQQAMLEGKRAAGYLTKYITKDGDDGRPEVLETINQADAPARPFYVQPGLSDVTMHALRRERYAHMLLVAFGCEGLRSHGCSPDGWASPSEVEAIIARLEGLERPQPPPARTDGRSRA